MTKIIEATSREQFTAASELFRAYAHSLDFSLDFQDFEKELYDLSDMYGPPCGALFLVQDTDKYVGVAGLRSIENGTACEVKRMYIRSEYQGKGIGKQLLKKVIERAKELGYDLVKLDTLGPKMPAAVALYKSFGFIETLPYNYNPYEGVMYFEKSLIS
jgi:putative acetyltransferase